MIQPCLSWLSRFFSGSVFMIDPFLFRSGCIVCLVVVDRDHPRCIGLGIQLRCVPWCCLFSTSPSETIVVEASIACPMTAGLRQHPPPPTYLRRHLHPDLPPHLHAYPH